MVVQQAAPRYLQPSEGQSVSIVGGIITIKVTGAQTNGAYSMFDSRTPPGGGVPPHIQHHEDESFYILEGSVEFLIGDETVILGPGAYGWAPRGTVHGFKNTGDATARMLIVNVPGGYHENFFMEAGDPVDDPENPGPIGEPDFGRLMAAAQKYGIEMLPPPGE